MPRIFRRPALARSIVERLLAPTQLDIHFRSGVFLSGLRRTGKTTFVLRDLVPALEDRGVIVVYVDLWSDARATPASLVLNAVRATLRELQSQASASADAVGFGFDVEGVGEATGTTLATAFKAVVDRTHTDVVLIVDEVQHALTSEDGQHLLFALKAARDAVNLTPGTRGHFIFVGIGSHRANVAELSASRQQAFAGAATIDYPLLGEDYVVHVLDELHSFSQEKGRSLPSLEAATTCFAALGNRPEEFAKALEALFNDEGAADQADAAFRTITATVRGSAADSEPVHGGPQHDCID